MKADIDAVNYLYSELYREDQELRDVMAFLNLAPDEYQEYSLNEYAESNSPQYRGMRLFVTRAFEAYPQMESVELLSFDNQNLTTFFPENVVYPYKDGKKRLEQIQDENYVSEGKLEFVRTILNPEDMKQEGAFIFTFSCEEEMEELSSRLGYMDLLIAKNEKNLVYMSKEFEDWKELTQNDLQNSRISGFDIYKEQQDVYQIYSILDRTAGASIPISAFLAVIGVGILIFGCGVFCINIYIKHLTDRVEVILSGMDQVTTGNLHVSLAVRENGDELDMISKNFNEMCRKLDAYIQKKEGMSIKDIFAVHGEEYFRNCESNTLISLQEKRHMVVSCGGGVPLREKNVALMKKSGYVVWLTATPEAIFDRVKDSTERPLLNGNMRVDFIRDLMESRREKYEAAADICIDTTEKDIVEICEELLQKLSSLQNIN